MAWPLPSAAGPGCPRAELEGSHVFRPWQSSVLTRGKVPRLSVVPSLLHKWDSAGVNVTEAESGNPVCVSW